MSNSLEGLRAKNPCWDTGRDFALWRPSGPRIRNWVTGYFDFHGENAYALQQITLAKIDRYLVTITDPEKQREAMATLQEFCSYLVGIHRTYLVAEDVPSVTNPIEEKRIDVPEISKPRKVRQPRPDHVLAKTIGAIGDEPTEDATATYSVSEMTAYLQMIIRRSSDYRVQDGLNKVRKIVQTLIDEYPKNNAKFGHIVEQTRRFLAKKLQVW